MSYLVLARKYRPQNFEALVGQSHVVQALANALTQQRLHHAYLFTGTRGVGKTTVSRILAKSLNCLGVNGQGGITATPCGGCMACRDIDSGRFVDYVELDAASNRGVEEISQLLDQAVYKPVVGRFKVYMIDEVHMLSNTAFNAMLKTLEEPPEYLKFVLATTDPQKVPPTVLSRCLQFNLRPIPPLTIQSHLAQVLSDENISAEPGALRLLSRAARGSMRDALSLSDQAIAFGAGQLTEDGVRQMLGAVKRSHCVGLLEVLARRDGQALVAQCHALREQGVPAAGTLEELAELCQRLAVYKAAPQAAVDDTEDAAAADTIARLAAQLAADELQLFYSMSLHGRAELHLAPDEHSALLMVMLRMLAFRRSGLPDEVLAAPAGAVNAKPSTPSTAAARRHPEARVSSLPVRVTPAAAPAVKPLPPSAHQLVHDDIPPWLDAPDDVDERDGPARFAEMPEDLAPQPPMVKRDLPSSASERRTAAWGATDVPMAMTLTAVAVSSEAAVSSESAPELLPVSKSPLGDRWAQVVKEMVTAERISALVRELAWNAECVAVDETAMPLRWHLRVERDMLRAPSHCDKLKAALMEHLQVSVDLQVEGGPALDTPAQRHLADRQLRQRQAEKVILEDPWVRSVLAQFPTARIVRGSIQPRSLSGDAR
ncbi:MAG: DNA polymerase III subunit gamma/tau [Pseudomonadota bacterium]